MACCDNWVKIRLLFTNFLIAGAGIAFIITVHSLYSKATPFYKLLDDGIIYKPILLLVIGWALLFLSIYGCCGVMFQNSNALEKYAILLIVIFFLQIIIGCDSLFHDKKTDEYYHYILSEEYALTSNSSSRKNSSIEMITMLQMELQCCGVNGPYDFFNLQNINWSDHLLISCCKDCDIIRYPCNHLNENNCDPYTTGCSEALFSYLTKKEDYIGKIAILFAFVDLAGIIQALMMAKNIKIVYKDILAGVKRRELRDV